MLTILIDQSGFSSYGISYLFPTSLSDTLIPQACIFYFFLAEFCHKLL